MSGDFELLVHRQALCGASPLWMSALNCVYWVDVLRRELHTYSREAGTDEVRVLPGVISALGATRHGQLIAAAADGFVRVHQGRAALEPVVPVNGPGDRMSAGGCDPRGRFVAGTVTLSRRPRGSALYVLDGERPRLLVDGMTTGGGVGWSPDGGRMYLVDVGSIWIYDYDVERGRAMGGRQWVSCAESEGVPEGLAVDADGCVWVAMHWTGRIHRYAPDGGLETVLWAPTRRVTGLAFGGTRLEEMYVTSACFGYDEPAFGQDPYAGALLRFRPGPVGAKLAPWQGV
ncbi:SMP-30/gluconolactonase/LRE family protein [Saccharopolyspora sp. HNM0983]|uniref:SMP-30/gluconolactonase/LRE family protein n=2 Tax=Saccharopolyspora montiporae TaxID=2781240 RepID=A0A929G032_9PSEU|nr:SMP-30/gluconolactonase/LRE family protein [Saccharopolyspora sp. HNM0983]MBE9373193.1 SMP-30/gluconolactonase/LRE family protein [Saccharopolyspora sp. HNM0983]